MAGDARITDALAGITRCAGLAGRRIAPLAPPAKDTQLGWLKAQLGVRVPDALRALLSWHNGERDVGLFDEFVG